MEKEKRAENLQYMWMSHNLQYKGLQEVLEKISKGSTKPKEPTVDEVQDSWRRLKARMSGL